MTFKGIFKALLVLVLFGAIRLFIDLYPDHLWFGSLGFSGVFWKTMGMRVASGAVFGIPFALIFGVNLLVAKGIAVPMGGRGGRAFRTGAEFESPSATGVPCGSGEADVSGPGGRALSAVLLVVAALFGLMIGSGLVEEWDKLALFISGVPFGDNDPLFGRDIGFYVFTLPFLKVARQVLDSALYLSLAGVTWVYAVNGKIEMIPGNITLDNRARRHFGVLGCLLMISFSCGKIMDGWNLLYSERGVAFGASYSDVHAQLPGLYASAASGVFAAGALLVGARRGSLKRGIASVVAALGITFLATGVYPGIVQRFSVKPNEITLEKPFIELDIKYTRKAYGIDEIEERTLGAEEFTGRDDLSGHEDTLENLRLWDAGPLMKTYKQLQEMRLYYDFESIFVDRYPIGGKVTQVMLSARELNFDNVPSEARTWVNRHIKYTHGHGICLSPVNSVTRDGLPRLLVKDIPPVSQDPLFSNFTRPEIYHGQLTNSYIFTETSEEEFDYPMGDRNKYCNYSGAGGVSIGSLFRKTLFALHFWDMKILLTDYLKKGSRILYHRNVFERVSRIAPFLIIDGEPYPVIADAGNGKRIYWILEGYTHTDAYPYSRTRFVSWGRGLRRLNYIRNSVKIIVDAYDGTVGFYMSAAPDPLIKAWSAVYPGLFKPFEEMPPEIAGHIRYPRFLFQTQAEILNWYHMTKPEVFYNQEDRWNFPRAREEGLPDFEKMNSSYLTFRLPEENSTEFLLTVPFTPVSKDNMVSLLVGRCDGRNYGKLLMYSFPKQKLVYGPHQIEARIDQQPEISKLLTLWGQKGSQVIRGEVLVIPVGNSVLYMQPMYLRASTGELPQFTRIILASGSRVAMDATIEGALVKLFEGDAGSDAESAAGSAAGGGDFDDNWGDAPAGESPWQRNAPFKSLAAGSTRGIESPAGRASPELKFLARSAAAELNFIRQAAAAGDWKEYGKGMARLQELLDEMASMSSADMDGTNLVKPDGGESMDPALNLPGSDKAGE